MTERRSMMAERDTTDRYLAAWLADRVGAEFEGTTSGIARFGSSAKLDETGGRAGAYLLAGKRIFPPRPR